jgi:nucleotide-binding universal stress UspA family protein
MAYKTLLTVALAGAPHEGTLRWATDLARAEDAHLDVLCIGIDRAEPAFAFAGAGAVVIQSLQDEARSAARTLAEKMRAALSPEDIRWAVEEGVAQTFGIGHMIGLRARFSDLVIMARPAHPGRGDAEEMAVEGALFAGGGPVVVLPAGQLPARFGQTVTLAWDGGNEALTAARAALPLLSRAARVSIAIVNPGRADVGGSEPGADLSRMLSRHGVKTEIALLPMTGPHISDDLNRHVRDTGSDLLVMGAYGHSRLRQMILGGTTSAMLEKAEVPVLFAR